jgi:hypothetical protein
MSSPVSSTTSPAVTPAVVNSSTKIYDKRDLNRDGKVTDIERLRYDVIHPPEKKKPVEKKQEVDAVHTYDQQGKNSPASTGKNLNVLQ